YFPGVRIHARDSPFGRGGLYFGFAVTKLREVAERHVLEAVASRADFLVNLVAALDLLVVPASKGAIAGKLQRLGLLMEGVLGGLFAKALGRGSVRAGSESPEHRDGEAKPNEDADQPDHYVFFPLSRTLR